MNAEKAVILGLIAQTLPDDLENIKLKADKLAKDFTKDFRESSTESDEAFQAFSCLLGVVLVHEILNPNQ